MPAIKTSRETQHPAARAKKLQHPRPNHRGGSPERLRELLLEALAALEAKRGGTVRRTNPDDDDEDPTRRAEGSQLP